MASLAAPPVSGGSAGPDAGSGGSGFDAEFSSALSSAYDSAEAEVNAQGEESPGGEGGAESTPPTEGEPATVHGETPEAVEAEAQPPALGEPYKLTADGNAYQVPKADMPALLSARKFASEVSQYFPSPQHAQSAYQQSADYRIMANDWLSGSPEGIKGVLNYWATGGHGADPGIQARAAQSFSQMASLVPEMLRQVAPQAYEGFAQSVIQAEIASAYARAGQSGSPEDLKRAQELDWGFTGQYKTEVPQQNPQQSAQEARIQQFEARQAQALQRDMAQYNNQVVEGTKFNLLNAEIDKVLAPLKARVSEKTYTDTRLGVQRDLIDTLRGLPEWWTEQHQTWDGIIQDFRATWQQGSPGHGLEPRIQAYAQGFLQKARQYLPKIAAERLNARRITAQTPATQAPKPALPASRTNGSPVPQKRLSSDEWDQELKRAMQI